MSRLAKTVLVAKYALLMMVVTTASAADPLARVHKIHIEYGSNANMPDCKRHLANAMVAKGLGVTSAAAQADAVLAVRMHVASGKLRSSINWSAVLTDHQGKRLYSAYGDESSWTAGAACKDLADDLAEELKDDIRNARILSF